jgi:hypothetical protein
MSQKYHTFHKRFTRKANIRKHKPFRAQLSITHNCTRNDKTTRQTAASWRNGARLTEPHQISCLHCKPYSDEPTLLSSGCVTTLTAVVGRRRQRQNYRQRSRDRLTRRLCGRRRTAPRQHWLEDDLCLTKTPRRSIWCSRAPHDQATLSAHRSVAFTLIVITVLWKRENSNK